MIDYQYVKKILEENLEERKKELDRIKKIINKFDKKTQIAQIQACDKRIFNLEKAIANLQEQAKYIREDNAKDIEDRLEVKKSFSKNIAEAVPDGVPMLFHGNSDIAKIHEIIRSGGLKTPTERNDYFTSCASQIDAANKYDIHVPVQFAEPGLNSCRPYGAIFAFYPKEDEIEKGLIDRGSEVKGGVQSIDFKEENDRLVGIITTEENKERIQEWLKESKMDFNKVYTHAEFLEMCKEKFVNKEKNADMKISTNALGKQVVSEMSNVDLTDEVEQVINSQEKQIENKKETDEKSL